MSIQPYAADLRNTYLLAFDNFATDPGEIVSAFPTINNRYARELLGILTQANLMELSTIGGVDVWQVIDPGTYDQVTREQAVERIDEWLAEHGADQPKADKPKAKGKSAPATTKGAFNEDGTPRLCLCGCGQQVNGKRLYKPGHDARHAGNIARAIAETPQEAHTLLLALGSDALRTKATAHAERLMKKTSKSKFEPVHGTVKIGRWEREVWTTDDTATHSTGAYYLTAKGEQVTLPEDKYESVAWDPAQ